MDPSGPHGRGDSIIFQTRSGRAKNWFHASAIVLCLSAAACSSASSGSVTSSDAGPSANDGSMPGADGSSPAADGGTTGDGSSTSDDDGIGSVVASSDTLPIGLDTTRRSGVTAFFGRYGGAAAGRCTPRKEGSCSILECIGNGDLLIGSSGWVSFGSVEIKGGSRPVTLTQNGGQYTPDVAPDSALFEPGDELTVSAAGDAAANTPSFSEKLRAPQPIELTAPAWKSGEPLEIQKSSDLVVQWSTPDATATDVMVHLNGQGTGTTIWTTCVFPASENSGVVPAAAMKGLPAGDGALEIYSAARTTIAPTYETRGPFRIELVARTVARRGNGIGLARTIIQ